MIPAHVRLSYAFTSVAAVRYYRRNFAVLNKCPACVYVDGVSQAPMACSGILTRSAGLSA